MVAYGHHMYVSLTNPNPRWIYHELHHACLRKLGMAAVIYDALGDVQSSQVYVAQVQKLIDAQTGRYDDFDSGRAGLLFAGHFLNTNLGVRNLSICVFSVLLPVCCLYLRCCNSSYFVLHVTFLCSVTWVVIFVHPSTF